MRDSFDPFAPRASSREGRLMLLGEAADALIAGRVPTREAALFVGGALRAWLTVGGDWQAHVRTGAKPGSHRTHPRVYATLLGEDE